MIPVISKNAYKFFFPDNYLLICIKNCPMVPLEDRHGKLLILFTDDQSCVFQTVEARGL